MIPPRYELPALYLLTGIQLSVTMSLVKTFNAPQRNNHQNISSLLDNLLRGYDNSIRPDFGGNRFYFKVILREIILIIEIHVCTYVIN